MRLLFGMSLLRTSRTLRIGRDFWMRRRFRVGSAFRTRRVLLSGLGLGLGVMLGGLGLHPRCTLRLRRSWRMGYRRTGCWSCALRRFWARSVGLRSIVFRSRPLVVGPFGGRVVRRPCPAGSYNSAPGKCSRLGSCGDPRLAAVNRRELAPVGFGSLLMLNLRTRCRDMFLSRCRFLLRGRAGSGSPRATVIAHVVHGGVVDNGLVIDIGDVRRAHVVYCVVVVELPVVPVSALVAYTGVAVAINDTAVETHLRPPIPSVPSVDTVVPAPITWSPQQSNCGRLHPSAGDPIVTIITVSPIPGRPDITFAGADGLLVHGQRRWRDVN